MVDKTRDYILWFDDITIEDVPIVGGKNAALGEMRILSQFGINIPNGFAVTAHAYRYFLNNSGLQEKINEILDGLDTHNIKDLESRGKQIRRLILQADFPEDLKQVIINAYNHLGTIYFENPDVAVRSSATAEDLPGASFAGQQETFLNVRGGEELIESVKKCFASLFTNRAISYRVDKGFSHSDVALSVAIQKMVRSDLASSGVAFSIDTESGFDKVIIINGSYGVGEMIVQGKVTPDEFTIFKPTLEQGFNAIIGKDKGKKDKKMIYSKKGLKVVTVPKKDRESFCLNDDEIIQLSKWVKKIEDYFSEKRGSYQPMDIEWAKDGQSGELFIVQARPETVHAIKDKNVIYEYVLEEKSKVLTTGAAVGSKIAAGKANIIKDAKHINSFRKGDILVTDITDPDWEPIMKIASAIITNKGGRTSHAAIVSRELGIPAIVGTENATKKLKQGQEVTVDCSDGKIGKVYDKKLKFKVIKHELENIPEPKTKIMINIGSPDEAFINHYLPVKGVGLGRIEFIINSHIQIHPNALIHYDLLVKKQDTYTKKVVKKIKEKTYGYKDKKCFYVDELAEGIAKIASVVWPNDAIIRFSDFKTNEYKTLIGGELYEPDEQNPMLGWRGASRYYSESFKNAFALECEAIKKARNVMGMKNIVPMVPFVRTTEEAEKVLNIMNSAGLSKENDAELKIYMMCEIPSNVILADEFLKYFDGFSIGSNDLTQLTLGLDRDSEIISNIANENDDAVRKLIKDVIHKVKEHDKYIGLCGQAPSDYPEFAEFLIEEGISSISLNSDVVLKTINLVAEKEKNLQF